MKIILILFLTLTLWGCQSHSERVYSSQVLELQAAKERGEISPAEYLKLKLQVQNAHEERRMMLIASPD